jgi:hypothetical protein
VEFDAPAVTSIGFLEDIYSRFREKFGRLASLFPLYLVRYCGRATALQGT